MERFLNSKRRVYCLLFVVLLFLEIIIALYVNDRFVRPYLGDVLVTALICSFFKIFFPGGKKLLTFAVFTFAVLVEIGQYFNMVELLGLSTVPVAATVLGNTFSILDIICYALGCLLFSVFEHLCVNKRKH